MYEPLIEKEIKQCNADGMTALHFAILQKNEELFFKIVKHEIEINDKNQMTPLMYAARAGRLQFLEYIVKNSKQFGMKDKLGKTALRHAFEALEFDEHLEDSQREDYVTQLQGIIQILLKPEVDFVADDGMTSLMFFAQNGALDLVKQLQVQYKRQDHLGRTALMLAAKKNQADVVKYLIPFESKLKDNEGRAALIYAIEGNAADALEDLIETEYNIFDNRESHAFHYAAKWGRSEIMVTYYDTY